MTRNLLAFAAASALGVCAAPAAAQEAPPPAAWGDPQADGYPAPPPMQVGPSGPGAPFAHPLPAGAYPLPYPAHGGTHHGGRGFYQHGPMVWHGESGSFDGVGSGYWYAYQTGGASCGCPSYTWVQVPIETHYRYSAPLRHEEEAVEEQVLHERVVESKIVPARPATKYVKAAPAKVTKGKVVRTTK